VISLSYTINHEVEIVILDESRFLLPADSCSVWIQRAVDNEKHLEVETGSSNISGVRDHRGRPRIGTELCLSKADEYLKLRENQRIFERMKKVLPPAEYRLNKKTLRKENNRMDH
jgi:hypothetical protein